MISAEEIIKKHTEKPDADYSNSWVKRAMEEYSLLKSKEAASEAWDDGAASWLKSGTLAQSKETYMKKYDTTGS